MSEVLTEHDCWLLSGGGDLVPLIEGGQGREPEEIEGAIEYGLYLCSWAIGALLAEAGWEAYVGLGTAFAGLSIGLASLVWWPV